ncbi:GNAT family N-acetyltransferase [Dactylosporangium sp. CA-092794]|uniref:GNAT family N-acetyltransferase n=1 Tax=Dactylosporangium sp. CA-092794 TaxID=3239929 RepID=UPI003D8B3525
MTGDAGAVTVRPARADDLPGLQAALGQDYYFEHRLNQQPALGILLVAVKAGTVVGGAFLRLRPQEPELLERAPDVPVLTHLEVAAEHQGNGVGSLLVQAAEAEARAHGRRRILLGVRTGDEHLLAIYEKRGYHDWGYGLINAVLEEHDANGERTVGFELCHIMIKALED